MPLPKFSLQFAFSWSVYFSNRRDFVLDLWSEPTLVSSYTYILLVDTTMLQDNDLLLLCSSFSVCCLSCVVQSMVQWSTQTWDVNAVVMALFSRPGLFVTLTARLMLAGGHRY